MRDVGHAARPARPQGHIPHWPRPTHALWPLLQRTQSGQGAAVAAELSSRGLLLDTATQTNGEVGLKGSGSQVRAGRARVGVVLACGQWFRGHRELAEGGGTSRTLVPGLFRGLDPMPLGLVRKVMGHRTDAEPTPDPKYLVHMQPSCTEVIQKGLPPGRVCVCLVSGGTVLLPTQPQVFLPNEDKVFWEPTGTEVRLASQPGRLASSWGVGAKLSDP